MALPVALPAVVAGYGAVCVAALLAGQFRPGLVLPVGLVVALVAGSIALNAGALDAARGSRARQRVADLVALLGAGVWTVVNLRLSSQNISVFRDPATYALTAQWLVHHPTAVIATRADVFGGTRGLSFASNGFPALPSGAGVQPQGAHLVQTLMASAGWLGGDAWVLRANVLIGGVALLAVYGLGRRLAGAWPALFAVGVLSLTLPMAEFSRAVYTEPLAMCLAFGGFTLLSLAHQSGRRRDFVVGGLVLGATTLTRIDGLFSILMVLPYLGVQIGRSIVRREREHLVRAFCVAVPVAIVTLLAVRDLQTLAPVYYRDLGSQVRLIFEGGGALCVAGVVVLAVLAVRPSLIERGTRGWGRVVPPVTVGVVTLGMAVLASRPLWTVGRNYSGGGYAAYITFLQKARHLPIEGTRGYSEITVEWLTWYVGVPALVVGTVGLSLLLARALRDLDPAPLLAIGSITVTGALYLVQPSITPDQLWASRRLLPLALPGLLLGAAFLLGRIGSRSRLGLAVAGVIGAVVLGQTAAASRPLWRVRQYVPQLAEVTAVCDAVPDDGAILVGPGLASTWLQTVRSYCDVPAAGVTALAPALLTTASRAVGDHGRRLYVVTTSASDLPGAVSGSRPFSSVRWNHWNATLVSRPSFAGHEDRDLFLSVVDVTGSVRSVAPSTLTR